MRRDAGEGEPAGTSAETLSRSSDDRRTASLASCRLYFGIDRITRGSRAAGRQGRDEARELQQSLLVHLTFERHDVLEGQPVFAPAPGVKLGLRGAAQTHIAVAPEQAQQIPNLLLAAVTGPPVSAHPGGGHVVAQPVAGPAQDLDVFGPEADLLHQLPVHGLFRRFAGLDPTLRELPSVLFDALAPEHLVAGVDED